MGLNTRIGPDGYPSEGGSMVGSNILRAEAVAAADAANDLPLISGGTYSYASFLYLGGGGDVTIEQVTGGPITLTGLVSGMWHPCPPYRRITALGGATGVLAGY